MAECWKTTHAASEVLDGDCEWCGRARCNGSSAEGRCKQFPIKGATVCNYHGGAARHVRSAAMKNQIIKEVEKVGAFWNPDAPKNIDVGEMLVNLAAGLDHTRQQISIALDRRMDVYAKAHEEWEARVASGEDECVCCGYNPKYDKEPRNPMDDSAARMWQFVVRELSALLTKIQALGIAERQIALQEQTAQAVTGIFAAALARAGIDDETAEVVRGEVLQGISALTPADPDPSPARELLGRERA